MLSLKALLRFCACAERSSVSQLYLRSFEPLSNSFLSVRAYFFAKADRNRTDTIYCSLTQASAIACFSVNFTVANV